VTVHAEKPIPPQDKSRELQRKLYLRAKRQICGDLTCCGELSKVGTVDVLNTPRRRLSESSAAREGKPHVRFDVAGDENRIG
jgi:hypothetical protein